MEKLQKIRYKFDTITSQNTTDWQLVLVWIVIFEFLASSFEYFAFDNTQSFISGVPSGIYSEIIIGMLFTAFVWLCVFNFIFWRRGNLLFLILFGFTGLYLTLTKDLTFNFLLHNLEPLHFFNQGISLALIIELLFKIIILYLIFRLVRIYRKRNKRQNQ